MWVNKLGRNEEGRRKHRCWTGTQKETHAQTYIHTHARKPTQTHNITYTQPRDDSQCHINAFLKSVPQEPLSPHPTPSPAQACSGISRPASGNRKLPHTGGLQTKASMFLASIKERSLGFQCLFQSLPLNFLHSASSLFSQGRGDGSAGQTGHTRS